MRLLGPSTSVVFLEEIRCLCMKLQVLCLMQQLVQKQRNASFSSTPVNPSFTTRLLSAMERTLSTLVLIIYQKICKSKCRGQT